MLNEIETVTEKTYTFCTQTEKVSSIFSDFESRIITNDSVFSVTVPFLFFYSSCNSVLDRKSESFSRF